MRKRKYVIDSLYGAMVIVFNCIMIPFLVISYSLYSRGANVVQAEITKTMELQTGYIRNLIQKDVARTISQCEGVIFDSNLQKLMVLNDNDTVYSRYLADYSLRNRLLTISDSNTYLTDVYVSIPNYGVVSAKKGFLDNDGLNEPQNLENGIIYEYDGKLLVSVKFYRLWFLKDSSEEPIIVTAELNKTKLLDELSALDDYNNSESYFLINYGNTVFSASDKQEQFEHEILFQDITKYSGKTLYIGKHSDIGGFQIVSVVDMNKHLAILSDTKFLIGLLFFVWVVAVILFIVYAYRRVYRPIRMIEKTAANVENGNTDVKIDYKKNDEFRVIFDHFERISQKSEALLREKYEQNLLLKEAENVHSQLQIKPHFLYNCFFLISSMAIMEDYENLYSFTTELTNYYKYLTDADTELSTLKREIDFAVSYCKICTKRFNHRITSICDDLKEEFWDIPVPKLILQPIVENAFKYAFEEMESNGILRIWCEYEDENKSVRVTIEDNGKNLSDEDIKRIITTIDSEGQDRVGGLSNINKRLRYLRGEESGVKIGRSPLGGLMFSVVFTVRKSDLC